MRAARPTGRAIRRYVLEVAARDGNVCCHCHMPIDLELKGNHPEGPTIEHLLAISHGGTNSLDNIRLAHSSCNKKRGNRPPTQLGTQSRQW